MVEEAHLCKPQNLLNCVFMTSIKKILLGIIKETGDDPNDVHCMYGSNGLKDYSVASDLPDGELAVLTCYSEKHRYELIRKGKEPQIEPAVRKAWHDERD